ncbi:MAG: hypothetical protein VSS75_005805 [Candidatus Parabeggiatoa sp.]
MQNLCIMARHSKGYLPVVSPDERVCLCRCGWIPSNGAWIADILFPLKKDDNFCRDCNPFQKITNQICNNKRSLEGIIKKVGQYATHIEKNNRECVCPCRPCHFGQNQNINLDISPMIHPSRRLIQFYIKNHESKWVWCRYIKIYVDYRDNRNQNIGRRRVTINDVILKSNLLQFEVEAGKEIIGDLEAQYDRPRIHSIYDVPEYDCCY